MRLSSSLVLGALLGLAHGSLVDRQNDDDTTTEESSTPTPTPTPTTEESTTLSTSTSEVSTSAEDDTTIIQTRTVTEEGGTISSRTTVFATETFTSTIVRLLLETVTETSSDQDTATTTIFETTTFIPAQKRDADLAPRTAPATVDAMVTAAPEADSWELAKRNGNIYKRETFTEFTTVTVGGDGAETTVVSTVSDVETETTEVETTTTSTVTVTDQIGASTTETVTSTITVTGSPNSDSSDGGSGGDSGGGEASDEDGGLSTGAQIGIGVGVGVVGLLVIAGLIFFCLRRRRRGPKPDPDELIGASEVPVVGSSHHAAPTHSTSVSANSAGAAALLAPHRSQQQPKYSPEGYRGTALGDGRSGYAKPAPYGAAYAAAPNTNRSSSHLASGDNYLPEHPSPSEMSPVSGVGGYPNTTPSPQPRPGAAELGGGAPAAGAWHPPPQGAAEVDGGHPIPPAGTDPGVYEMSSQSYK